MRKQIKELEIEFINIWESGSVGLPSLVSGISIFGCYNKAENKIHVFLDQILQASVFAPEPKIDWILRTISRVVFHELLHALEPSLSENEVVWAEDTVFGCLGLSWKELDEDLDWEDDWNE